MALSTGPVLAAAAITLGNQILLDDGPPDWNAAAAVMVGAGIVAGGLALVERPAPELATGLAWAALAAMLLLRLGDRPSPTERLLDWWEKARK